MLDGLFGLLTLRGQTYVTPRVLLLPLPLNCVMAQAQSHMTLSATTQALSSLQELCLFFLFISSFLSFFRVWGEDFSLLTFYFLFFFLFLFFIFLPLSLVPRKPHFPCERLRLRTVPRFRALPSRTVMLHAATSPFQRRNATRPSGFTSLSQRERSKAGTSRRREKKTRRFLSPRAPFFSLRFYQRAAVEAAPPCGLNSASVEPPIRQMTFLPLTAGGYYLNY